MSYLKKQLTEWRASADLLDAFDQAYGANIPDGLVFGSLTCSVPAITLSIGHSPEDRNKALTLYGDLFGRSGWEMTPSCMNRNSFDWEKTIDGVKLVIYGAEAFPERDRRVPVPPAKFPIQIADTVEEVQP